MSVKLGVTIELEGKDQASKVFDDVAKSADNLERKAARNKTSWTQAVTAISTSFLALKEALGTVTAVLAAPVKEALEAEESSFRLATALEVAGRGGSTALQKMQDYASELSILDGVQDDLILKVEASNTAFGLSESQMRATTLAAMVLARVTGEDLNTANQNLLRSLTGVDRSLKLSVPEVNKMTDAQLRAGGAINALAEKAGKVLGGDMVTAYGQVRRLSIAFGELKEAAGNVFINGAKNMETFVSFSRSMEVLKEAFTQNEGSLKNLAEGMSNLAASGFGKLIDWIVRTSFALQRQMTIWEMYKTMVDKAIRYIIMASSIFSGDEAKARNEEILAGIKETEKENLEAYNKIVQAQEKWEDARAKILAGQNDPKNPQAQRFTGTAPIQNDAKAKREVELRAQVEMQIAQLSMQGMNQLEAEREMKRRAALAQQEKAAADEINIEVETRKLIAAIDTEYALKKKNEKADQEIAYAKAVENTTGAIELEYEKQLEDWRKVLVEQNKEYEKFLKIQKALRDKADKDIAAADPKRQKLSEVTGAVSEMINGARSGALAIANTFLQKFGIIGNLIASIVNFFGMGEEEFRKMIDGIFQYAVKGFTQDLMRNGAILIRQIGEGLPEAIKQALIGSVSGNGIDAIVVAIAEALPRAFHILASAEFWKDVTSAMYRAFVKSWGNVLTAMFQGGKIEEAVKKVSASASPVKFGSDDPNAAGAEFKIKDAQLRAARRAEESVAEKMANTLDSWGEGLVGMLLQAWKEVFKMIGEEVERWGAQIWKGLNDAATTLGEWGTKIWKGLLTAIGDIATAFGAWGTAIWKGLERAVTALGDWGAKIWAGLKTAIGDIATAFGSWGTAIWNGLTRAATTLADWGTKIWNGLNGAALEKTLNGWGGKVWAGIKGGYGEFTTAGSAIWNSMSTAMNNGMNIFRVGGAHIWGGFKDNFDLSWLADAMGRALGSVTGGGGGGGGIDGNPITPWYHGGLVTAAHVNTPMAAAFSTLGALHFAGGGVVPGTGFRDTVPALMRPGEVVSTPEQVRDALHNKGGDTYNFTFHVAPNAVLDRRAVKEAMPIFVEEMNRTSRNGKRVAASTGVY